jgi:hypothetical protein
MATELENAPLAASAEENTPTQSRERGTQTFQRRPDRKFQTVWLCLSGLVIFLSMVMQIRNSQQVNVPFTQIPMPELCSFRRMTGMDCAGCGLTRCFISLGHGDLRSAWAFNPSGFVLYGIILFQIPFRLWQLLRIRRGLPEVELGRVGYSAMIVFAVAMLTQWVIKQTGMFW